MRSMSLPRPGRAEPLMPGLDPIERLARGPGFLRIRRDRDDLVPHLDRAVEILLAHGAYDADVEQRLDVLRVDLQRLLELRERAIGLVRVVIRDAEVGADVDILRVDLQRRGVPVARLLKASGVEVEIRELDADRFILRVSRGAFLE